MRSYRDLQFYSESKRLAIEIHKISLALPKHELYEEGSQFRRSSKSVSSNIVEAYGRRRYKADFIKHLIYSQSQCETMVHLDFLFETQSWKDQGKYLKLLEDYQGLSKRINKFIQGVEKSLNEFDDLNPATSNL